MTDPVNVQAMLSVVCEDKDEILLHWDGKELVLTLKIPEPRNTIILEAHDVQELLTAIGRVMRAVTAGEIAGAAIDG